MLQQVELQIYNCRVRMFASKWHAEGSPQQLNSPYNWAVQEMIG